MSFSSNELEIINMRREKNKSLSIGLLLANIIFLCDALDVDATYCLEMAVQDMQDGL